MGPGECTITLQDIAIQYGLRIDGRSVIGQTDMNKFDTVEACLGIRPSAQDFKSSSLKLSWLDNHFGNIEDHLHDPEQLNRFTRACMLRLIGGFILADHSSARVNVRYLPLLSNLDEVGSYSWGSAALGYLYKELCNATDINRVDIGGLTPLVQLWAWERFPKIAPPMPTYDPQIHFAYASRCDSSVMRGRTERGIDDYRRIFDRLKRRDIVWEPYSEDVIAQLPDICRESTELWRGVVPLICFHVVEWHQPDRCMRQFGMVQHIPIAPSQPQSLHDMTLRGKVSDNWEAKLEKVLEAWARRYQFICSNLPQHGLMNKTDEYIRWYKRITRRWILRDGALAGTAHDVHERLHYMSGPEGSSSFSMADIHELTQACLNLDDEADRICESGSVAPEPTQEARISEEHIQIEIPRSRREGRSLRRRRTEVHAEPFRVPPLPERQEGIYTVPPEYPFHPSQLAFTPTYYYPPSQPYQDMGASSSTQRHTPDQGHQSCYVPDTSAMYSTPALYDPLSSTPAAPDRPEMHGRDTSFDDLINFDFEDDDILALMNNPFEEILHGKEEGSEDLVFCLLMIIVAMILPSDSCGCILLLLDLYFILRSLVV